MTKLVIPLLFISLVLMQPVQAAVKYVYQVTSTVSIPIKVTKYEACTKEVKERKEGRWVYTNKKTKCPKEVEAWRTIRVIDVFKAADSKSAIKKAIEHYKDKGYKYLKLIAVKKIQ